VRTEGIADLLDAYPDVKVLVDSGYRGLANDYPDQVIAPLTDDRVDCLGEPWPVEVAVSPFPQVR
jgi:hypothetical protein